MAKMTKEKILKIVKENVKNIILFQDSELID